MFLLLNTSPAATLGTILLLQCKHVFRIHLAGLRSMKLLFEDRIGLDRLKLGLEITNVVTVGGAAVGATTGVGEIVAVVLGFFAGMTPKVRCES